MKFAHSFDLALRQSDEYPKRWVDAAISYRRLKKCIKDVQRELQALGLSNETIKKLWHDDSGTGIHYKLANYNNNIRPKLIFQINVANGTPVSATFSPETRHFLQTLAPENFHDARNLDHLPQDTGISDSRALTNTTEVVEVPLTADSRFFHLLSLEMSRLGELELQEDTALKAMITPLASIISNVTNVNNHASKNELYAWRQLFSLYTESQIFFSTNELERFEQKSGIAKLRLERFAQQATSVSRRFKNHNSHSALNMLLALNVTLLQNLKFQELNLMAMTKILKKFDKRTALGAKESFPELIAADSFSSSRLAKSICFEISQSLLSLVPQLDDYLCPVCFSVAYRPIKLECKHIFCIRCMIVMQRTQQDHCPLCRGAVIMKADSGNIDYDMMEFLKKWFPREVKAKQRSNERDVAKDRWGGHGECMLM